MVTPQLLALCLRIFFTRILDVSLGTVRTLFTVKGKTAIASLVGFVEVMVWFLVVRTAFNSDEAGLLPHDLKRGVLSEDAIYNLLADDTALRAELRQFIDDQKEEEESCDAETEETGIR